MAGLSESSSASRRRGSSSSTARRFSAGQRRHPAISLTARKQPVQILSECVADVMSVQIPMQGLSTSVSFIVHTFIIHISEIVVKHFLHHLPSASDHCAVPYAICQLYARVQRVCGARVSCVQRALASVCICVCKRLCKRPSAFYTFPHLSYLAYN